MDNGINHGRDRIREGRDQVGKVNHANANPALIQQLAIFIPNGQRNNRGPSMRSKRLIPAQPPRPSTCPSSL
jgi:hypothetical protein